MPLIPKTFEKVFATEKLHWTTVITEKFMLAVIGILTLLAAGLEVASMVTDRSIALGDIFLLFIYTEIIGMIGAFYASSRIPVTLPIIIAITALCRLIVMQSKEMGALIDLGEAGAILILSIAAIIMSFKDKVSLEKIKELRDSVSSE